MTKKFQSDSKYAVADADGDGTVTDSEMDRHSTWIRLENEDKQADTQRMMALISMLVSLNLLIKIPPPLELYLVALF